MVGRREASTLSSESFARDGHDDNCQDAPPQARMRPLLIGIVILAALFVFNGLHPAVFELAELKASDLRMYMTRRPPPTGAVVIAAIEQKHRRAGPLALAASCRSAAEQRAARLQGRDRRLRVLFSEHDEDDVQAERSPRA